MRAQPNSTATTLDVVGDAYAVASQYLRKSGLILDTGQVNDRLLEMIIMMVQRGETGQQRLADMAIARFQTARPEGA